MKRGTWATAFAVLQALCAVRVYARMLFTSPGEPLRAVVKPPPGAGDAAAVVPVLDERERLGPCLEGLIAQGAWLREILVVDGGSRDGTQALAVAFAARDARVRVVDAAPVPAGWNGKAWGLHVGLGRLSPAVRWFVGIDADVRPAAALTASLIAHAHASALEAFSAAPRLVLSDALEGLVHPAMLTTLVVRRGLPGTVATSPERAQADGQCFFASRELLARTRAFELARASRCEDVTVARELVRRGIAVGFFEAGSLANVEMFASGAECWRNWPRSLPLRDAGTRLREVAAGLAEIALVQALPLALALVRARARSGPLFRVNAALLAARLAVLAGMRRAYARAPATYWLSPLADLPVAAAIARSAVATHHRWRGRALVGGERNVW